MKKILSAVLTGLVIAGTMAMGAAAADPTLLWDFGEDGAMDAFMQSPTTLEWYGEKKWRRRLLRIHHHWP